MRRCSLVAIAALLASVAPAAADSKADNAAASAAYKQGRRHYDLREWDAAIESFKQAYKLRPDAPSLFNIAQSYRLAGDCVEALAFYETYRRNFPKEKNLAKVDGFIAELEPCAKDREAKQAAAEAEAAAAKQAAIDQAAHDQAARVRPSVPATPPAPPPEPSGRGLRVTGITIGGAGVVAAIAAGYFGLQARSKANEVANGTGLWNPELESSGKHDERVAEILGVAGGVAVIGGTVLYLLGRRAGHERANVAVVPGHGGATLVWSCGF